MTQRIPPLQPPPFEDRSSGPRLIPGQKSMSSLSNAMTGIVRISTGIAYLQELDRGMGGDAWDEVESWVVE